MEKLWALVMATILISFGSIAHAIDHKANLRISLAC